MLVSDVLVTDYSSAIYEFSLLEKPIVFFAPDYEAYERERGFYFDYRTGVPGPIFETTRGAGAVPSGRGLRHRARATGSARRRSPSQMEVPQHASRTVSSFRP